MLRKILAGFPLLLVVVLAQAPEKLQPPHDQQLILRVHAKGDQIYTCKDSDGRFAWVLKAPEAQLFGEKGEPMGRHFAGPAWEAGDGSRVLGKMTASAPSPEPDSIPWLLVSATEHQGSGLMSRVLSIQRLNTKGGKAPGSGCDASHAGAETRAGYEADYHFYGTRQ